MAETKRLAALESGDFWEFFANKEPKCPHCGSDFSIRENEAWQLYNDNEGHDVTCPSCELDFIVNSSATWVFSTDAQE